MSKFEIWGKINPNAHNPRYGVDCHAAPVVVATIVANTADEAVEEAYLSGHLYNPERGQYKWLYHSVKVAA